jgi:hypothetical protein
MAAINDCFETTLEEIGGSNNVLLDIEVHYTMDSEEVEIKSAVVTGVHYCGGGKQRAVPAFNRRRFPKIFKMLDHHAFSLVFDDLKMVENAIDHQANQEPEYYYGHDEHY